MSDGRISPRGPGTELGAPLWSTEFMVHAGTLWREDGGSRGCSGNNYCTAPDTCQGWPASHGLSLCCYMLTQEVANSASWIWAGNTLASWGLRPTGAAHLNGAPASSFQTTVPLHESHLQLPKSSYFFLKKAIFVCVFFNFQMLPTN